MSRSARAGMATTPRASDYASIQDRLGIVVERLSAEVAAIYAALGLDPKSGGVKKCLFRPVRDL